MCFIKNIIKWVIYAEMLTIITSEELIHGVTGFIFMYFLKWVYSVIRNTHMHTYTYIQMNIYFLICFILIIGQ